MKLVLFVDTAWTILYGAITVLLPEETPGLNIHHQISMSDQITVILHQNKNSIQKIISLELKNVYAEMLPHSTVICCPQTPKKVQYLQYIAGK